MNPLQWFALSLHSLLVYLREVGQVKITLIHLIGGQQGSTFDQIASFWGAWMMEIWDSIRLCYLVFSRLHQRFTLWTCQACSSPPSTRLRSLFRKSWVGVKLIWRTMLPSLWLWFTASLNQRIVAKALRIISFTPRFQLVFDQYQRHFTQLWCKHWRIFGKFKGLLVFVKLGQDCAKLEHKAAVKASQMDCFFKDFPLRSQLRIQAFFLETVQPLLYSQSFCLVNFGLAHSFLCRSGCWLLILLEFEIFRNLAIFGCPKQLFKISLRCVSSCNLPSFFLSSTNSSFTTLGHWIRPKLLLRDFRPRSVVCKSRKFAINGLPYVYVSRMWLSCCRTYQICPWVFQAFVSRLCLKSFESVCSGNILRSSNRSSNLNL